MPDSQFNERIIALADKEYDNVLRRSAYDVLLRLLYFEVQRLPGVGKKNAGALVREVMYRRSLKPSKPRK